MQNIGEFQRTLPVSGPVDLEIRSHSGQITVHTGGEGEVRVVARMRARASRHGSAAAAEIEHLEKDPPVTQEGNTIRIGETGDAPTEYWLHIDYDLTVPARTRLSSFTGDGQQTIRGLQLPSVAASGSGDIWIEDASAGLTLSSGSGNLHVKSVSENLDVPASDPTGAAGAPEGIIARSGSGNVEMSQIAASKLEINTGSGNVRLNSVRGALKIKGGSGTIFAESQPTNDWHLALGSGNIKMKVPAEASFELDACTLSGVVRTTHPLASQDTVLSSHLRGKVGAGGVLVNLRCGSGNIEIL